MKQTKIQKPDTSDYCCPLCKTPLVIEWGNGFHKGNKAFGGFLSCPERKCPAQEVKGHGRGRSDASILQNAYQIIMAKFTGEKIDLNQAEEQPEVEQQPVVEAVVPETKIPRKSKTKPSILPVVAIEKVEDALWKM